MQVTDCRRWKVGLWLWLALALVVTTTPAAAQSGTTITNGTATGITTPGFLFEPEVPFASLKTAPTWNELEQLLDNPYAVALCSTLTIPGPPLTMNLVKGTPGTDQGFLSYCSTIQRRISPGVALPPLLVDALNYNPTTGEEMRLLNLDYSGGTFPVPVELVQCSDTVNPRYASVQAACATHPSPANTWIWAFENKTITPGSRTDETAIDYNAPVKPDPASSPALTPDVAVLQSICITTTEAVPPEGDVICGGDPGEPNYAGFGVLDTAGYSTPAIALGAGATSATPIPASARLYAPDRGAIESRDASGNGGLRKPSLRVPENTGGNGSPANPYYLINTDPNDVVPSNENDYVRDRTMATVLGKALFWDMQVGSDGVQACGTCHFNGTGTDSRTKNQLNPNHLGGDLTFQLHPPNSEVTVADFPLHKLVNPEIAGDPACASAIKASVNAGVLENNFPNGVTNLTVCDAANVISDVNDVVSSMGVHWGRFLDIPAIGTLGTASAVGGVKSIVPDLRSPIAADNVDPIPGFAGSGGPTGGNQFRRVEPRNTPTMQAAAFNFDNFWDGRARHDFNGGSVFGASDPQGHVYVDDAGTLTATRQIIRFTSIASLATGPGLSEFEMSFFGRNWAKVGKKLLQPGVTPLANQLVATTDSVLGPYSNQGGSACAGLAPEDRSGDGTTVANKPGLCISYAGLIRQAFYPALWQNTAAHLEGCYTDGRSDIHPNQCAGTPAIPVLASGAVNNANTNDPFDGYVLTAAAGPVDAADTNQFTQMEGNFSLFWGLGIDIWVNILVPDNTPFDQFLDRNPDAFAALGEPGEPGLVPDQANCTSNTQRYCFRPFGNFRRDSTIPNPAGGNYSNTFTGSRPPNGNSPDPLLGLDIFFASNLSLKNPNFRTARCGECHAVPTLTDHTVPFTFKAQLRDFVAEFSTPGAELAVEPLGRLRTISGFLLESELNENGQDGVERRIANQSIVPCPTDGLAYPGGMEPGSGQGFGVCSGAAAGYFDNGVYNLGVRPISEDLGRGGTDAFGWPLSLAAMMMKNVEGPAYEPGVPMLAVDPTNLAATFEESAQDQQINPGVEGEVLNPQLPPYLAPFMSEINVGDAAPELDEIFSGLNTLTNIGMLEGFLDTLGPFNPAGVTNESLNMGDATLMGSWPMVNRVGRMGSFKAPQLRNVELTGPYFHNGGKLTLRQVVDFYTRGGDFPMTNAQDRDFNMVNMNVEVQSNLKEAEKVALVDFLLELTDDRNRFDQAPFDHPEVFLPLDGTAPENTFGRDGFLAATTGTCTGAGVVGATGPCFLQVPAVGAAGMATPEPNFLGIVGVGGVTDPQGRARQRLSGNAAFCSTVTSQYCH